MKRLPKCPRCGALPVRYVERWSAGISFEADNGIPRSEGLPCHDVPECVIAECVCGYNWRVRKVTQIIEIAELKEAGE